MTSEEEEQTSRGRFHLLLLDDLFPNLRDMMQICAFTNYKLLGGLRIPLKYPNHQVFNLQ